MRGSPPLSSLPSMHAVCAQMVAATPIAASWALAGHALTHRLAPKTNTRLRQDLPLGDARPPRDQPSPPHPRKPAEDARAAGQGGPAPDPPSQSSTEAPGTVGSTETEAQGVDQGLPQRQRVRHPPSKGKAGPVQRAPRRRQPAAFGATADGHWTGGLQPARQPEHLIAVRGGAVWYGSAGRFVTHL